MASQEFSAGAQEFKAVTGVSLCKLLRFNSVDQTLYTHTTGSTILAFIQPRMKKMTSYNICLRFPTY